MPFGRGWFSRRTIGRSGLTPGVVAGVSEAVAISKNHLSIFAGAVWFAATGLFAVADVVETKNGARLVGKVTGIDAEVVTLETDYAGQLKIKKTEVASVETEGAQFVRLDSGAVVPGRLMPEAAGRVRIQSAGDVVTTPVAGIRTTWALGAKDPELLAREPKWSFEASADITGKTGNGEEFGSAYSVRIKRTGPQTLLQLYSAYKRQVTDDSVSDDQFRVGVDYTNNFAGRTSWYARSEGGYDYAKDIDVYNIAGTGFGYDFIKQSKQILTGRIGLSFRYEAYGDPDAEELKSAGLDTGVHHEYTFRSAKLVSDLTYVPAFEDFANYRAVHDSYFEIPITTKTWKLRLGVTNDYTSRPGAEVEKLDTTYYSRFVLNWK